MTHQSGRTVTTKIFRSATHRELTKLKLTASDTWHLPIKCTVSLDLD